MKIYGKEIDFKITKVSHAQKFHDALKVMEQDEKKLQGMKSKDLASFLTSYIRMFQKFFVNATGQDVLQECDDAVEAKKAYLDFLEEIKKEKESILKFNPEDIQ